jgi:hypothetical protein
VEADCLDSVSGWGSSQTRIIASQHWYGHTPADLRDMYLDLRDRCAVVKLVGTAHSAMDVLPVLELLRDATTPVIALAMGAPGTPARIMAPAFPQCLLTYGAASPAGQTAPGQITVDELTGRYALHLVTADTRVYVHVVSTDAQHQDVLRVQDQAVPGAELHVPVTTSHPALPALLARTLPAPFTIV